MFEVIRRFVQKPRFGWKFLSPEHTLVTMTASFLSALLAGVICGYTAVSLLGEVLGVVVGVFAAQTGFLLVWLLVFCGHIILIPLLAASFYGLGLTASLLVLPAPYELKTVVLSGAVLAAAVLFGVWAALFMAVISLWGATVSHKPSVKNEEPGK